MKEPRGTMTPRERVRAAVRGLPVDRVPVMYWLNPHAACRLLADIEPGPSFFWNLLFTRMWRRFVAAGGADAPGDIVRALPLTAQLYANADYALHLGADLANVPFGTLDYWFHIYRQDGRLRVRDVFGSVRGMGGIYLDVIKPGVMNIRELVDLRFKDATGDQHYAAIRKFRARHPESCIYTDNFGVQDLPTTQIWDMPSMMVAMVDYPAEVKKFMRRMADYQIDIARRSIRAGADVIFIYDDYGYTGRTLLSMAMWKEFTLPELRRQIDAVHDAGGIAMLHSCGLQMPFLPHYVEAGLDVLETFQPKAGNDLGRAMAEFGDRLCFCTGIDVQQGESMTPDQFRDDILRAWRIGRTGRHILGTTHMMQYTMPAENVRTMLRTVREIQGSRK